MQLNFLRGNCLRTFLAALALLAFGHAHGAPLKSGDEIVLWQTADSQQVSPAVREELHNDIANVREPALVAFVPAMPNGISMIVVPGGSYRKLVAAKEGAEIARWLNGFGITAFVLKHRLPNEGHAVGRFVVLQDGQRAIRSLRHHASAWQLDPARIGIMGFSAGGNLAAATGTAFEQMAYPARDDIDAVSARPDFMALIYPAVGFPAAHGAKADAENFAAFGEFATDEVPAVKTPPAFMVVAADDKLVQPVVRFWQALASSGNLAELHVAAKGGHGFAQRYTAAPSVRSWPALFETWLKAHDFLK